MPTDLPSVSTFTSAEFLSLAPKLESLTDQAAFWLRRDIVRGVFSPDERLTVDFLSRFYEIGRSPVQAAILQLEPSGLLHHEHQKGYRVAPASLADYNDVTQFFNELTRIAIRKSKENGSQEWEERVIVALHRTSRIAKVIDHHTEGRELWQLAFKRMHGTILSGCGSPLLMETLAAIGDRAERYIALFATLEPDLERDHQAEHRELVDTILDKDVDEAVEAYVEFQGRNKPLRDTVVERLQEREAELAEAATSKNETNGKGPSSRKIARKKAVAGARRK